jgi:hypothetical protein
VAEDHSALLVDLVFFYFSQNSLPRAIVVDGIRVSWVGGRGSGEPRGWPGRRLTRRRSMGCEQRRC